MQAVRSGNWKLHVEGMNPAAFFDLDKDIGEKQNVLEGNPEVAKQLLKGKTIADSRVAKMKDGTTHLAYKTEHVVDVDSNLIVAA